ncbi:MAG: sigma-70 family RNA polymerase sigma factor [Candidatus Gastranaerophilales bacterium]|nr:sigma-70 family RNA polymerase sigma factor [Candidatus Gastranaerophilales bacterium]
MNNQSLLKQYVSIVQRVAKIEQRRVPNHMIEYEELVSIGIIAVQAMIKNKTEEQLSKYNDAYMGTAVKWAIRNELRHRYKWYSLKHKTESDGGEEENPENPNKVKEAVYEAILSIDGLAAAATDNDSPFDFIKDPHAMPDENAEIVEMSRLIKEAIATLPQKERTVVEYRFYRNMQAKDIATMIGLSPSRITRIIQGALVEIREYLKARGRNDY